MNKVALEIERLSHSVTTQQSYAVVLVEVGGLRKLPILIGAHEAQAIAVAMENMNPSRPLTHDLLKSMIIESGMDLIEVIIDKLVAGVFHAKLVCEREGEIKHIDSRTSDALALAVRFDCPVFTYESVLDSAGVVLENPDIKPLDEEGGDATKLAPKPPVKDSKSLKVHSISKLNKILNKALGDENYELAARIRDEIQKRSASK